MRRKNVSLNIDISPKLMTFLKVTAESEGVTITEIVRRALSVVIVFDEQIKKGRNHIGFASDPSKMDAELLGILTPI